MIRRGNYLLSFILIYITAYYGWIFYWKGEPSILAAGGNAFSTLGALIPAVWMFIASRQSAGTDRPFWLLLSLGCLSYFTAELIWMYEENILGVEVPFPGVADLFYMLQILFYLAGFVYKLSAYGNRSYRLLRFLFDVSIVVTVAVTFSWHYIIKHIISNPDASGLFLFVSMGYPIGDLVLLLGAVGLFLGPKQLFPRRTLMLVCIGLVIQVVGDSNYLFLVAENAYASGSWIDPLYTLSLLITGAAGLGAKGMKETESSGTAEEVKVEPIDYIRLVLPYASVIVLFAFMLSERDGIDAFTTGAGISILFVIVRQVMILIENQRLLNRYHQRTQELDVSKQKYESLFQYHPDAVCSLDLDGSFRSANPVWSALSGNTGEALAGQSIFAMFESNKKKMMAHFAKAREGKPQNYEISMRNKKGGLVHLSFTLIPMIIQNQVVGVYGIGKDITENKINEKKISFMAYHDPLTGLKNRRFFEDSLQHTMVEAQSTKEILAVMYIDLDRFKTINDTLGHDIGDELLVSVAKRLKVCLRHQGLVARQGGDEFTVLIRGMEDIESVGLTAQQILDSLSAPYHIKGYDIITTPSIGIAVYPRDGETPAALMKNADLAMYRVKQNGKKHYSLYDPALDGDPCKKLILEKDLSQALRNKELRVYYQPQVDTHEGIFGVEALLRWNHPELGTILPSEFIPIAEENGLIFPIGEMILQAACKQTKIWHEAGYPIKVGVNISPKQFKDKRLVDSIVSALNKAELEPRYLDLEITESIAMGDMNNAIQTLNELKQLGVHVSIDDFGTGYSSFSYLANLPVDTLKIAREFIQNDLSIPIHEAMIVSLVAMAKNLNLNIIAEGVETETQSEILKKLTCHRMQGYWHGKPVPVEEMMNILNQNAGKRRRKKAGEEAS